MAAAGPAFDAIADEFESVFGRRYSAVESVGCEDADLVLVTTGSVTSTARLVVAQQRQQGKRVGLCKIKQFRPFPAETIRAVLGPAPRVAVIDRNVSFGSGGIFAREIQGALCPLDQRPAVYSYIAGLGGRDITPETIAEVLRLAEETPVPEAESRWVGLNPEIKP
jgi:pyruvate/2-oxoacid:ferredoxin oxidoreductase alpha subunit